MTYPEWGADYVSLEDRYLDEADYERIAERVPAECPTCGGAGSYLAPGDVQAECNCRRQRALYKHYLAAGIGELYMRVDWLDWEGDASGASATRAWLTLWRGYVENGIGIVYSGTWGTGKTMLGALAAKELVKLGQRVYFTTYSAMVEMFAAGWRDREEQRWFERKVVECKVLVLDDIGKEMVTALSQTTFDHVMRQRAVALRPTIITTNMTRQLVDQRYGGGSLSLLGERAMWVEMASGQDYRAKARERANQDVAHGWRRPIT